MHYQISRNGQQYGPYTLEDIQRYVASGNILPTDMAKNEEMADWVPVSQLLTAATSDVPPADPASAAFSTPGYADPSYADPGYANPGAAPVYGQPPVTLASSPYQDAPNLNWGLVLLFSFLTCSLFMWIWNLVIAAWLKRVQPNATSLYYYLGAVVLFFLQVIIVGPANMHHAMTPGLHTNYSPVGGLFWLCTWVVRLIARYSQRASLEEHFNTVEPVGLRLNPVMTFFFGGLYFQYHLNRINEMKQAARFGAGRAF